MYINLLLCMRKIIFFSFLFYNTFYLSTRLNVLETFDFFSFNLNMHLCLCICKFSTQKEFNLFQYIQPTSNLLSFIINWFLIFLFFEIHFNVFICFSTFVHKIFLSFLPLNVLFCKWNIENDIVKLPPQSHTEHTCDYIDFWTTFASNFFSSSICTSLPHWIFNFPISSKCTQIEKIFFFEI